VTGVKKKEPDQSAESKMKAKVQCPTYLQRVPITPGLGRVGTILQLSLDVRFDLENVSLGPVFVFTAAKQDPELTFVALDPIK
jgi:hypothetical protein